MIQKIKSYSLSIVALLTLLAPVAVPVAVSADNNCTNNAIAQGISTGASKAAGNPVDCSSTGVDSTAIGNLARNVVNVFSIVVGAVAIIMIIYGGFRYVTSGGDSNRVGAAKNTLIYAIVGLIIVALAQLIVHFVLAQSSNITSGTVGA